MPNFLKTSTASTLAQSVEDFWVYHERKTSSQEKAKVDTAKERRAYLILGLRKRCIEDYEPYGLS
jgi:hypothetical protein